MTATVDLTGIKATAKAAEGVEFTRAGKPSVIDKYPHIVDALRTSLESGKPLAFPTPNANTAATVARLLRLAARKLNCGVSIRVTDDNRVAFEGKPKRAYTASV
jgi:hypothetical protein